MFREVQIEFLSSVESHYLVCFQYVQRLDRELVGCSFLNRGLHEVFEENEAEKCIRGRWNADGYLY